MVFKNQKTEKWEVRCYYKDYKGIRKQKTKRGFRTKSEALDWERHFKLQDHQDLDMTIKDFFELYKRDVSHKVRPNTWEEKENIILTKILPYIGKRKINELKITDVFEWQREIKSQTTKAGKKFSQSYLKTIHNQLSGMWQVKQEIWVVEQKERLIFGLKRNIKNSLSRYQTNHNPFTALKFCIGVGLELGSF